MTSLNTLPIPHFPSGTTPVHEHAWLVDSRHPTSEGTVVYVRCGECGMQRVDLQAHPQSPPTAVSREVLGWDMAGAEPLRP